MSVRFQKVWKFYFWFSLVGLVAGLLLEFKMGTPESSPADIALNISAYVIEVVALVCLYGFAWQMRFGKRIFCAVFFIVSVGYFSYTIGYEMLSDVDGAITSGYFVVFLIAFMFLILLPQFIANYLYAFRSKHLWANAP